MASSQRVVMSSEIIKLEDYKERREALLADLRNVREYALFEYETLSIKDKELNLVKEELIYFFDAIPRLFGDQESVYNKLDLSILFAKILHEGQERKFEKTDNNENKPYLAHLLRVARYVADKLFVLCDNGANCDNELKLDILRAALFHDSVEDRFLQLYPTEEELSYKEARVHALDEIERKFGERVRHYVHVLSKPAWEDKSLESYHEWLDHIWQDGDEISTILKFADLRDNFAGLLELYGFVQWANFEGEYDAVFKYEQLFKKYIVSVLNLRAFLSEENITGKVLRGKIMEDLDKLIEHANDIVFGPRENKDFKNMSIDDILNSDIIS